MSFLTPSRFLNLEGVTHISFGTFWVEDAKLGVEAIFCV